MGSGWPLFVSRLLALILVTNLEGSVMASFVQRADGAISLILVPLFGTTVVQRFAHPVD